MNQQQTIGLIRSAGVIGAGGAGFPTWRKLETPVERILVNGAECEPLLSKDRELMLQASEDLFRGLVVMQALTGARHVTIAVKKKNSDVLDFLEQRISKHQYDAHVMDDVYPSGDEYVLVYEVTGKRIPPRGIPPMVGCLVVNVETTVNVAHAVNRQPVTQKWVTICGAVAQPITTVVPVGTSFRDCITLAGGSTTEDPVVLTGGVMMGGMETDLELPVTKTIGGVIVLPRDHYIVGRKSTSQATYTRIGHGQCDQCSLCTELCPRYLLGYPIEPHRVMRTLLMTGSAKARGSLWAEHCCECNICSLVACPEGLDPMNICVDAKGILREQNLTRSEEELRQLFQSPHPVRKGREVPISKLYQRLGLAAYDRKAPYYAEFLNPNHVTLPLNSHIGMPAQPIVQVGDQVTKGQFLAEVPKDKLGCPVHSSIDGRVTAINEQNIELTAL
jgi:Na+-translocating ferredoxin:NAD+ oxidoreductase RnfC subunit